MLASTDGPPKWLRKVVKEIFGKADLQVSGKGLAGRGAVVTARRSREAPSRRDHDHVIQVPRGNRMLQLLTRPGVFSPGRLDGGARALLTSFTADEGERVLDLGCGIGVLGLAAAADGAASAVLVDSSARAVDTSIRNANSNDLAAVEVVLRSDLEDIPGGPFDRVLANPPYFSNGRIADAFARTGAARMADGGVLHMVAKAVPMHREILERHFRRVEVGSVGDYGVFTASGPR